MTSGKTQIHHDRVAGKRERLEEKDRRVNRPEVEEYRLVASVGLRRVVLEKPIPVHIRAAGHSGRGTILNVSKGGAFVSTRMNILLRSHVYLWFPLDTQGYTGFEAVAVWESSGLAAVRKLPQGYGFCFVNPSWEERRRIRKFMAIVRSRDDCWATVSVDGMNGRPRTGFPHERRLPSCSREANPTGRRR